jgi:hypothetical protein
MKTKICVQTSDTGLKWLTMEIEDLNGRWLYRSKRLANEDDIFTDTHIFHSDDHLTNFHRAWHDATKEQLSQHHAEKRL